MADLRRLDVLRGFNALLVFYLGLLAVFFALFGWLFYICVDYYIKFAFGDGPIPDWVGFSDLQLNAITFAACAPPCAFVGWRLARKVMAPLHSIGTAVRKIAGGDLSARANEVGKAFGEARTLIRDFNTMAARLEQAEAELRYSNSAIAHELRTPLTILRGHLQGMMDGVFGADAETYTKLIRQVDDLSHLVDDLRISSLFAAGHLVMCKEQINLAIEIDLALKQIQPEFDAAGLKTTCRMQSAQVEADGARIRQVALAILDNARRYASPGRIEVEVEDHLSEAVIRFSDDGPGLPKGLEERVFDRFWRGESSRSRATGGSGLGLAVVKAIIEAHDGTINTRSRPSGGAIFEICLPKTNRQERSDDWGK